MSDARNEILQRLREARARTPRVEAHDSPSARLSRHARGPQPEWPEALAERFDKQLQKAAATWVHVSTVEGLAQAAADYMAQQALASELVVAPHRLLSDLRWPPSLSVHQRAIDGGDIAAITVAFAAIAETGSLMLLSGPETPTRFNFLPDHFLCVVPHTRIVAHIEDGWDLVRQERGGMPRSVNFITGPSRTADVEQTIQLGAHGPRRVHVIVLD